MNSILFLILAIFSTTVLGFSTGTPKKVIKLIYIYQQIEHKQSQDMDISKDLEELNDFIKNEIIPDQKLRMSIPYSHRILLPEQWRSVEFMTKRVFDFHNAKYPILAIGGTDFEIENLATKYNVKNIKEICAINITWNDSYNYVLDITNNEQTEMLREKFPFAYARAVPLLGGDLDKAVKNIYASLKEDGIFIAKLIVDQDNNNITQVFNKHGFKTFEILKRDQHNNLYIISAKNPDYKVEIMKLINANDDIRSIYVYVNDINIGNENSCSIL